MRKIAVIIAAALMAASCNADERHAREAAENFLKAYYAMDYAIAEEYCTMDFVGVIEESIEGLSSLPESISEKMKEAAVATSFEIVSVTVSEDETSAVVDYLLSAPGLGKPAEKRLRLLLEGGTALVDAVE